MIDLTPLDVRKKRGDFGRGVRGYNPQEVDAFLELVAERLEELVKENITLRERAERLAEQVAAQTGREQAVQEALVTAQQLRDEIQANAQKEAELALMEARARGREILAEAERRAAQATEGLDELDRRRLRFLGSYRQFLERELDHVAVEEGRKPLEGMTRIDIDPDLGASPVAEVQKDLELGDETDVFPSLVGDTPGDASPEEAPPNEENAPEGASPTAGDAEGKAGSGPDPLWMPNFPRKSPPGSRD